MILFSLHLQIKQHLVCLPRRYDRVSNTRSIQDGLDFLILHLSQLQIGLLPSTDADEFVIPVEQILNVVKLGMLVHHQLVKELIRRIVVDDVQRQGRITDRILHAIPFQSLQPMHLLGKKIQLILHYVRGVLIPEPLGIFAHELGLLAAPLELGKNIRRNRALANGRTTIKIQYFQN